VEEGNALSLCCELSRAPAVVVQWRRGDGSVLSGGDRYQVKQSGPSLELFIRKSQPEDSGVYCCVCDEELKSTAAVVVTGETCCPPVIRWHLKQQCSMSSCILCTFAQLMTHWLMQF